MPLKIPADPLLYLTDRTVFIMGAGRTGTTILGSVIASMRPVFYVFEPVLLRLMPYVLRIGTLPAELAHAIRSTLFEDYLLPLVQGRNINPHPNDKTYHGNYFPIEDIRWRGLNLNQRRKAIAWIMIEQPVWLIKLPELQVFAETIADLFPKSMFIHIIRNGLDVVGSCARLNWYCDLWCNQAAVEWVTESGVPWYLDDESSRHWPKWNQETRAACVWRTTTQLGRKFAEDNPQCNTINYEEFREKPYIITRFLSQMLNVRQTSITKNHIESILSWEPKQYPDIISKIQPPELSKFCALMTELEYELPKPT